MRTFIAGFLTLLIFLPLYYIVPRMKMDLEGFGTSVPKRIEVLILVSDTFVNYFYVLLPVLFMTLLYLLTLVLPASDEKAE
jgi:type II secretory pathway component PulF